MLELKTSDEWQKLCHVIVYDPDGWDRKNYDYSWKEEKITREEFEKRLMISTCHFVVPIFDDDGNVNNIWKDK